MLSTPPCPFPPSFWGGSHTLAFLSLSMQSCFPPCCYRLPVLIPSTSAIHSFLLVSQLLRKPWSTGPPAQPTTLQWRGDTGPSLEVTYQATQCRYHSCLWEKKPQSADISLKQTISRDKLMLTRKVTKWADRKKIFCTLIFKFKARPRHLVKHEEHSEGT